MDAQGCCSLTQCVVYCVAPRSSRVALYAPSLWRLWCPSSGRVLLLVCRKDATLCQQISPHPSRRVVHQITRSTHVIILIRGQVWPRGWSPLLLRGGAQEDLAFWVGSLYTCPGKGLFALRSHCSRRGAAIQPQRFKQARAMPGPRLLRDPAPNAAGSELGPALAGICDHAPPIRRAS